MKALLVIASLMLSAWLCAQNFYFSIPTLGKTYNIGGVTYVTNWVTNTWSFASDSQGLFDQGLLATITFAHNASLGNSAGSVVFTTGTKGLSSATEGSTNVLTSLYTSYGVPGSAIGVIAAQLVGVDFMLRSTNKLAAGGHRMGLQILDNIGGEVALLVNTNFAAQGTNAAWQTMAPQVIQTFAEKEALEQARVRPYVTWTTDAGGGTANVIFGLDNLKIAFQYYQAE